MKEKKSAKTYKPLQILAIGAHPDDVELCCAGTLARCIQRGDKVTIALACRGDSASMDLPGDKISSIRSREALHAARVLGAELIEMGMSDYGVDLTLQAKQVFSDVIRQTAPDVIFTHYHTDYGSDHNNTFVLVRDAALAATVGNFRTSRPAVSKSPLIYMWEPLAGYGFQPEIYVDITETFSRKVKMLNCHRSQREWFRRRGGVDFLDYIEVVAKFRGYQSGVRFAEGFIPLKNWANIGARSVLP
ncbi:MAG: PIG-L family deacetylase [Acidobacteria bacterium]|nr:PIG-L family deacetylase [Acidobacteriota bacterium]